MFKDIVKIARNYIAVNINSLSTVIQTEWLKDNNYKDYQSLSQQGKKRLSDYIRNQQNIIKQKIDSNVSNQMYKNWIYNLILKRDQNLQDIDKLINITKKLESLVKHLQFVNNKLLQHGQQELKKSQLDIKYFSTYGQLHRFVQHIGSFLQEAEVRQQNRDIEPKSVFPFITNIGKYDLYTVSKKQKDNFQKIYGEYGYDTGWCVAQRNGAVDFGDYLQNMDYYYLILTGKKPFALLSLDDFQFKDIHDDPIIKYDEDLIKIIDYVFKKQNIDYDYQFDHSQFNDLFYYFMCKQFKDKKFNYKENEFLFSYKDYSLYRNLMIQDVYVVVNDEQYICSVDPSFENLNIYNGSFNQDIYNLYCSYILRKFTDSFALDSLASVIKIGMKYNLNTSKQQNEIINLFIKSTNVDIFYLAFLFQVQNDLTTQSKTKLIQYLVEINNYDSLQSAYNSENIKDKQLKNIITEYYTPLQNFKNLLEEIKQNPNKENVNKYIQLIKKAPTKFFENVCFAIFLYSDYISKENIQYLIGLLTNQYKQQLTTYQIYELLQSNYNKTNLNYLIDVMIQNEFYSFCYFFEKLSQQQKDKLIQKISDGVSNYKIKYNKLVNYIVEIKQQKYINYLVDFIQPSYYKDIMNYLLNSYRGSTKVSFFNLLFLQKVVLDGYTNIIVLNDVFKLKFDINDFVKFCIDENYNHKENILSFLIQNNDKFTDESKSLIVNYIIENKNIDLAIFAMRFFVKYRNDLVNFILDNYSNVNQLYQLLLNTNNFYILDFSNGTINRIVQIFKNHKNQSDYKNAIEKIKNSKFINKDIVDKFNQIF